MGNIPPNDTEGNRIAQLAEQYVKHGWYLVPLAAGDKMPTEENWSRMENCLSEHNWPPNGELHGIGLAHRYSRTCTVDLDDLAKASEAFAVAGIDIHSYLNADDAVKIISGRENRSKLLYRLPSGVDELASVKRDSEGFELRCATKNGTTLQDVLPPSVHPATGKEYTWLGDWRTVPELPEPLLQFWVGILDAREQRTWEPGAHADLLEPLVDSALAFMDPDMDYNEWLSIGMALDTYGWGDKWDEWSSEGAKYRPGDCEARLYGFTEGGGVTIGTLWHYAREAGWNSAQAWDDFANGVLPSAGWTYDECIKRVAYVMRICDVSRGNLSKTLKEIKAQHGVGMQDVKLDLRDALKEAKGEEIGDELSPQDLMTHYLSNMKESVLSEGNIWRWDGKCWRGMGQNQIIEDIHKTYGQEGKPYFQKSMKNYQAGVNVARLIMNQSGRPNWFRDAAFGISCDDGFWTIEDGVLRRTPNVPELKQRISYAVSPNDGPSPLLDALLQCVSADGKKVLQEFLGMAVLGRATEQQRAMLLYGDSGTGKSTLLKLIGMIFGEAVSSVSPANFRSEYYIAELNNKIINAQSEIPKDKDVDSSEFKAVLAGDLMSARPPYGTIFSFHPRCAHIFTSNSLPQVSEPDAAFWRRWLIVHFKGEPKEQITNLAEQIFNEEIGQFVYWCLQGAERVAKRGEYYLSAEHNALIDEWAGSHNIFLQCLNSEHSPFIIDEEKKCTAKQLYDAVKAWAIEEGYEEREIPMRKQVLAMAALRFKLTRPKNIPTYHGIFPAFDTRE